MKMKFLLKAAFYTIWVSFAYTTVLGQGLETFENHSLSGTSYVNGSFVGNNDITWYYVHCTGEQAYPIENKGILLRRSEVPSSVSSSTISGGIGNFSVQMRKAFTSTGDRQIELFINGESKGVSQTFGAASGGDETIHTFTVNNINIDGDFVIEIRHITGNTSNRQLVIDNLTWTGYSSGGNQSPIISSIIRTPHLVQQSDPVSISAEVVNATSVELRWGLSSGSLENVIPMVVWGQNIYVTPSEIPTHYNGTTIYYAVYAEGEGGQETSPTYNYMVRPVVYEETFEVDLGECQTYSVSGETKQWVNISGTAQMYGDNSGDTEEDWLILPSQNLDEQDLLLSFDSWKRYGVTDANNYLKLYYSSNYPGQGDPTQFTWTELAFTQPETDQVWTPSGTIDLSNITGSSVYIGFKYLYTAGNYVWWDIDNIKLERKTYSVTFNVVDGTMPTGTDPINTATVDFYGAEKQTNASGQASFSWIEVGDNIPFTVNKNGFHEFNGTLSVVNKNITQQVRMLSTKVAVNVSADPSANTAVISWEGEGAEAYRILYSDVSNPTNNFINANASPVSILVSPETTYTVRVRSLVDGQWTNYSPAIQFTTPVGEQVVASGVSVDQITSSSARINWVGQGATTYRVRYLNLSSSVSSFADFSSSPATIIVDPETTYEVRVSSLVAGLWSPYSSSVQFTSLAGTQVIASDITVDEITTNSARVNWLGQGADAYRVRYLNINSSITTFTDFNSSPATIIVEPETTYEVRVSSLVGGKWSPYSSSVLFTSLAGTQVIASNVSVDEITTNSARVNWIGEGADVYRIYYYALDGSDKNFVSAFTSPTIIAVQPEKEYAIRIKSLVNGQWSSYSPTVYFSTPTLPKNMDVDEVLTISNFLLYPNPARDYINIEFLLQRQSDVTISLIDIRGALIKSVKLNNQDGLIEHKLDLTNLPNGLYFIRLSGPDFIETNRLIIQ